MRRSGWKDQSNSLLIPPSGERRSRSFLSTSYVFRGRCSDRLAHSGFIWLRLARRLLLLLLLPDALAERLSGGERERLQMRTLKTLLFLFTFAAGWGEKRALLVNGSPGVEVVVPVDLLGALAVCRP